MERTAPKLERQRSAAKAKQADVAREKRERLMSAKHRAVSVRLRTGELVRVDHLLRKAWALPVRRSEAKNARLPEIEVRQGEKGHSTGRCHWHGSRLTFTFGRAPDMAEVVSLVLHEAAHYVTYEVKGSAHGQAHGTAFWSYFRAMGTEWAGTQAPVLDSDRYENHDRMTEFLRREL